MPPFTLCAGFGAAPAVPEQRQRAAASWQALGLEQLLLGEADLPPEPQRRLLADVATNGNDEPLLADLLRHAASQTSQPWLLLVAADAVLSPELVTHLAQLCAAGPAPRLLLGRAWRLPEDILNTLEPFEPVGLTGLIDAHGRLDPPDQPAWLLLPRGRLQAAPPALACDPGEALPWLAATARDLGWPLLDATAVAPLLRPGSSVSVGAPPHSLWPRTAVLPHQLQPPRPILSLLLAAPQSELERLSTALQPSPSLPWEVIARPADPADGPAAHAAAWNSALAVARGDLAWPLTAAPRALALLPAVLRRFERPGLELLLLAWQLGEQCMPARDAWYQEPGCLVAQTAWLKRLGGFDERLAAAATLLDLRQRAEARGACTASLPLIARQRSAAGVATPA